MGVWGYVGQSTELICMALPDLILQSGIYFLQATVTQASLLYGSHIREYIYKKLFYKKTATNETFFESTGACRYCGSEECVVRQPCWWWPHEARDKDLGHDARDNKDLIHDACDKNLGHHKLGSQTARDKILGQAELRSHAMKMFQIGLRSRIGRGAMPKDTNYIKRCYIKDFKEEHFHLFPVCVQQCINTWYPFPA